MGRPDSYRRQDESTKKRSESNVSRFQQPVHAHADAPPLSVDTVCVAVNFRIPPRLEGQKSNDYSFMALPCSGGVDENPRSLSHIELLCRIHGYLMQLSIELAGSENIGHMAEESADWWAI